MACVSQGLCVSNYDFPEFLSYFGSFQLFFCNLPIRLKNKLDSFY